MKLFPARFSLIFELAAIPCCFNSTSSTELRLNSISYGLCRLGWRYANVFAPCPLLQDEGPACSWCFAWYERTSKQQGGVFHDVLLLLERVNSLHGNRQLHPPQHLKYPSISKLYALLYSLIYMFPFFMSFSPDSHSYKKKCSCSVLV